MPIDFRFSPNLLFDRALPPLCVTVDTLDLDRAISMGLLSIFVTDGGNGKFPGSWKFIEKNNYLALKE